MSLEIRARNSASSWTCDARLSAIAARATAWSGPRQRRGETVAAALAASVEATMGAASTITTRARQLRIPGGKLEDDGPAHAVADDDRAGSRPASRAQRGDVVGEAGDRVVLVGCVALAVPAEVDARGPGGAGRKCSNWGAK